MSKIDEYVRAVCGHYGAKDSVNAILVSRICEAAYRAGLDAAADAVAGFYPDSWRNEAVAELIRDLKELEDHCTQCGWSGTSYHACPGLPGENEF